MADSVSIFLNFELMVDMEELVGSRDRPDVVEAQSGVIRETGVRNLDINLLEDDTPCNAYAVPKFDPTEGCKMDNRYVKNLGISDWARG